MKSNKFNLDQADKHDARRRAVAYNFSGISPFHLSPTGVTVTSLRHYGSKNIMGIIAKPELGSHNVHISVTIDLYRYAPLLFLKGPDTATHHVIQWVDNVAGYSNLATGTQMPVPLDMYENLSKLPESGHSDR
ncbi:hypothetical protein EAG_02777 [Camponotus floridanus]|uniref:Uncharacterized protein n=1 Tax=Camponotus floridanus TaxID=104421 RepID=E2AHP3_CAMFO|nr:hypothetical protein EAG_02777 [Camponotus floridanus]